MSKDEVVIYPCHVASIISGVGWVFECVVGQPYSPSAQRGVGIVY